MTVSIVIDSASSDITYTGTQWQTGEDNSTFSRTYRRFQTDSNATLDIPPKLAISFQGTGISFFGQPTDSLQFNYTFDGVRSRPADVDFKHGIPGKTGVRLWGIKNVTAGYHTLEIFPTAGQPILDYVVVTPDSSSYLSGKILALDDTDTAIKYTGNWTSESGSVFSSGIAYNDTSHGSTAAGASFTVSFTGASISVYGILSRASGKHSSNYFIDNEQVSSYEYSIDSNANEKDTWLLHQKLFTKDVIPGNHNLTVKINEVSGAQTFWLDYILFEGIGSTTISPAPLASKSGQSNQVKLIEGLVITGVVLFLLFLCFRRRIFGTTTQRRRSNSDTDSSHHSSSGSYHYDPPASFQRAHLGTTYTPPVIQPNTPAFFTGWFGPHRDDRPDTRQQLQVEMEILRRENEMMRMPAEPLHAQIQPTTPRRREEDAGPADEPPPYNSSNYIP